MSWWSCEPSSPCRLASRRGRSSSLAIVTATSTTSTAMTEPAPSGKTNGGFTEGEGGMLRAPGR